MKQPRRELDPDLVWQHMLSLGKGWTIQDVANSINSATGENWTRQVVSKKINKGGLKKKWEDLQKLASGAAPETQELMDRVARRIKLEDLTSSSVALEAYNEAIIKAAQHLINELPKLKFEKASDFTAVMSALGMAINAQATSRKDLAEILSLIGAKPDAGAPAGQGAAAAEGGNVLSLRKAVEVKATGAKQA